MIFRRLTRPLTRALRLAGAGALVLMLAPLPQAQEAGEEAAGPDSLVERYGAWTVQCASGNRACQAFQQLSNAENGQRLVRVTVLPGAEDGTPRMRLLVPLGPQIESGVVLTVDETEPKTATYVTCLQRGCIAQTEIDEILEEKLRAGEKMFVAVAAVESGRVVRFELSLNGVSRAMDRLFAL